MATEYRPRPGRSWVGREAPSRSVEKGEYSFCLCSLSTPVPVSLHSNMSMDLPWPIFFT